MIIKFILKNFFRCLILLISVILVSFILVVYSPIDTVKNYIGIGISITEEQKEEIIKYWEFDEKPIKKFEKWTKGLLNGDMGISFIYRQPVIDVINEKFKASFMLMLTSWLLSGVIGFILGIVMGVFKSSKYSFIDFIIKSICIVFSSVPIFWFGILSIMIFSVYLGWFPIGFSVPIGIEKENITFLQKLHHMMLPAFVLSITSFSNIALHTRMKIIDIINSDYVIFARARGENLFNIIKKHCIKNAFIPAITLQFVSISEIFGGSIIAEQIFSYPGLGQAIVDAGIKGDINLLLGITIISSLFVFFGNFISNVLYIFINPQIRKRGV